MSLMKQAAAGIRATKEEKMKKGKRIIKGGAKKGNLILIFCCILGLFTACTQEPQPQEDKTLTSPKTQQEQSKKHKQGKNTESKPKPSQKQTQTPIQTTSQSKDTTNNQEQDSKSPAEVLAPNPQDSQSTKKYTQEMLENITGEERNEQVEEDGRTYNAHITYKNGTKIKHGKEILYYLDGGVAQRAFYIDGKKEGLFQMFSQKGVLIYEAYYRNGLLHGPCKLFDVASGKIKSEMNFAYGLQVGQMNIYDIKSGKLWHQLHYKQGKKDGKAVEFDESGKIVREVFYRDDIEIRR